MKAKEKIQRNFERRQRGYQDMTRDSKRRTIPDGAYTAPGSRNPKKVRKG